MREFSFAAMGWTAPWNTVSPIARYAAMIVLAGTLAGYKNGEVFVTGTEYTDEEYLGNWDDPYAEIDPLAYLWLHAANEGYLEGKIVWFIEERIYRILRSAFIITPSRNLVTSSGPLPATVMDLYNFYKLLAEECDEHAPAESRIEFIGDRGVF